MNYISTTLFTMSYLPLRVPASFGHRSSQSFSRTTGCTQFPDPRTISEIADGHGTAAPCTHPLDYILLQRHRTTTPKITKAMPPTASSAHSGSTEGRGCAQHNGQTASGTQHHVCSTLRETEDFFRNKGAL